MNPAKAPLPLAGRTAVVTGPTGLGFEIARGLAAQGARIVLAGRNPARGQASVAQLLRAAPGSSAELQLLDLGDLASVDQFAARAAERLESIDILVNNAGVMMPPVRQTTVDGFELQFGTNHLGHFALTLRLLPLLRRARAPRVVTISSLAHGRGKIDFDDLQCERRYRPFEAYAQSKLANLLFAFQLQRLSDRLGWGLSSMAAHPGYARTDLIDNGPGRRMLSARISRLLEPLLSQSAADGARPALLAAASANAAGGAYFGPGGFMGLKGAPARVSPSASARDRELARRLWSVSEQLAGCSLVAGVADGR